MLRDKFTPIMAASEPQVNIIPGSNCFLIMSTTLCRGIEKLTTTFLPSGVALVFFINTSSSFPAREPAPK